MKNKRPAFFKTTVNQRLKQYITTEGIYIFLTTTLGYSIPLSIIRTWSQPQRAIAEDYAARLHLNASDNLMVRLPQRPDFLPLQQVLSHQQITKTLHDLRS